MPKIVVGTVVELGTRGRSFASRSCNDYCYGDCQDCDCGCDSYSACPDSPCTKDED